MSYDAMLNGIAPSECTCTMTREPRGWGSYNGPEPAEWEQDPLCIEHPAEGGTYPDPIQSAPLRFRRCDHMTIMRPMLTYGSTWEMPMYCSRESGHDGKHNTESALPWKARS